MPAFFLTFGADHMYAHRYQIIFADDRAAARALAFDKHGTTWAFIYDEDDFKGQPEQYGLTPRGTVLIQEHEAPEPSVVDALRAVGLRPIVIDENTRFPDG